MIDMPTGAVRLRLPEILKDKGMSQATLAVRTGLSENAVSKLCNNPNQIKLDTIDTLCKALEITPGELFDYIPEYKISRSQ